MAQRFRPVPADSYVTSPFGPRGGAPHRGADFGLHGGSANMAVYSMQKGVVVHSGAASGFGGPDPAGWLVVKHDDGTSGVYGHIIREVPHGTFVDAGQRIARVNPDRSTNGNVAPHVHVEVHPGDWAQGSQIDPIPWLGDAPSPDETTTTGTDTMATVIDFSASLPSAASIKNDGHAGAMLYCAPGREAWMKGKQPPREYLDDLDEHGIKFGFVWQFGGADNPDAMRGYDGGVADAKAAQEYLNKVKCAGHPVYFAVDFDIDLTQWNTVAYRYFTGAISVLGKQRVGIYGHSRVVHWAMEDGVVGEVAPGRVLGWVTKSWKSLNADGSGKGSEYATLFQGTHNVPGPDGVQIDINDVWHDQWGWTGIPAVDSPGTARIDLANLPRVDNVVAMNKHYTRGRKRPIRYVTRHHLAGIGDGKWAWGIWQDRAASAHYVVGPKATVDQLVRHTDTAWGNADAGSNNETIVIEHSNSTGAPGWSISDPVIRRGAELAAEILFVEDVGRPLNGVTVRDHRDFSATSCPHHLARGGKYDDEWIHHAQAHYDAIVHAAANPAEPWPEGTIIDHDPTEPVGTPAAPATEPTFLENLMSEQNIQSYINPKVSFPAPVALSLADASNWRQEVLDEALMHALGIDPEKVIAAAIEADHTGGNRTLAIRRALGLKEIN